MLAVLTASFAAVNLYFWFPGVLLNDSAQQYAQSLTGHLTDWWPPITARLWMLSRLIVDEPWPLFALNTVLYWAGFGLISQALLRSGRRLPAVIVLLGAASPLFLFFNREIITDVGLASALVAAFGIIFWFRVRLNRLPKTAWPLVVAILTYGTLVRANALFAVPPLILYASGLNPSVLSPKWLLACASLSAVLVPLTISVNRLVLGAADSGAVQRLQIYDIVGVAYRTGDYSELTVATAGFVPTPLSLCYSPVLWDTLIYNSCGNLWSRLPAPGTAARERIERLWIRAIFEHPVAYAVHRLEHFNLEIFFMVPSAAQCVSAAELHDCTQSSPEPSRFLGNLPLHYADYIVKNPIVWPVTWIVLATMLAFTFGSSTNQTAMASNVLLMSGLLYGLGYLAVGIAMNVRYFYWTILCVQTAAIMLLIDLGGPSRKQVFSILLPVIAVILVGYTFRIGNIDVFVR